MNSSKSITNVVIVFFFILKLFFSPEIYCCRAEMTAYEIIKKCDDLMRGKTHQGVSEMEITTPNWKRTINMEFWSEGTEKFFIHITSPAREKGTTFLKTGNLLYQWLPSAEMRIKITPSMMLQSWMGSDFTNDDLVKESSMVNDYTHNLLGRETINGMNSYKIQCIPKPDAPVVWGKLIIWISVEDYVPLREEFYSEKGEKIKELEFTDIKQLKDRKFPMTLTMTPLNKKGNKTMIRYNSVKFDEEIDPDIFTMKNLERPR